MVYEKENEGRVAITPLAPGISISFNQIYTNSWTKGDSSLFSDQMLIINFCLRGSCDVSLTGNRYAIVGERQVCASTILPAKDFYYPLRLYEGIQLYVDRAVLKDENGQDLLTRLGIKTEQIVTDFCGREHLYLHRMNETLYALLTEMWEKKETLSTGELRYLAVRLIYELREMPTESESDTYFTRSQIAIVKEAESLIMQDLSKQISAKEMAARFGVSESSFKLYVKGILGDSYLSYFRKKRMEKAAGLLQTTNLKVIEIANAVGYENQGKFAKVFAGQYHMTPMEFRRLSHQEKTGE